MKLNEFFAALNDQEQLNINGGTSASDVPHYTDHEWVDTTGGGGHTGTAPGPNEKKSEFWETSYELYKDSHDYKGSLSDYIKAGGSGGGGNPGAHSHIDEYYIG